MLTRIRSRRAGRLRRAPRESKEKTLAKKGKAWVCANVYLESDGYNNLVTCAVVCGTRDEAKRVAFEKAANLLDEYNREEEFHGRPKLKFEQAWTAVDHDDGINIGSIAA